MLNAGQKVLINRCVENSGIRTVRVPWKRGEEEGAAWRAQWGVEHHAYTVTEGGLMGRAYFYHFYTVAGVTQCCDWYNRTNNNIE